MSLLLLSATVLSTLVACSTLFKKNSKSSSSHLEESTRPAQFEMTNLGLQLTQVGENDSPAISSDGKKLVFISRGRPGQPQSQVFVLDLESRRAKRLTFQDGDCSHPIFLKNDKQIVYSSTTDELKDHPLLFQKKTEPMPWPPSNLYLSDLKGTSITRLTRRGAYDGKAWPQTDKSLVYNQAMGPRLELWQFHLNSNKSNLLLSNKEKSVENLRLSTDEKQSVRIEHSPDQIILASSKNLNRETTTLKLPQGIYRDLSWISPQKLMFSAQILKKPFQIYQYDLPSQCLQLVIESNHNLLSPVQVPKENAVILTAQTEKISQIFYKDQIKTDLTSNPCLKWQESEASIDQTKAQN